jgi:hypothetical protein
MAALQVAARKAVRQVVLRGMLALADPGRDEGWGTGNAVVADDLLA